MLPDGTAANVPSLYMGPNGPVQIPDDADDNTMLYIMQLMESQGNKFPRFSNVGEAVKAAQDRSAAGGVR